ncbi:MAG: hypothetical protein DMD63_08190 [Gemmatimonadetes bacterium]|nr:MAG: hypothetical protein DMD63_08190 [Gemmatimonadota bacterium]
MSTHKKASASFRDIEKPHPTVADDLGGESGGESGGEPMTVRLGDLWSDFIRVADEARDPEAPRKPGSAVPLLDEMKGILQWD